jgi:hypothetical protein
MAVPDASLPSPPQSLDYAAPTHRWSLARWRPACCRPVIWWLLVLIVLSFLLAPCVWVIWATFSPHFHA